VRGRIIPPVTSEACGRNVSTISAHVLVRDLFSLLKCSISTIRPFSLLVLYYFHNTPIFFASIVLFPQYARFLCQYCIISTIRPFSLPVLYYFHNTPVFFTSIVLFPQYARFLYQYCVIKNNLLDEVSYLYTIELKEAVHLNIQSEIK
jgi:hypothetical protein